MPYKGSKAGHKQAGVYESVPMPSKGKTKGPDGKSSKTSGGKKKHTQGY